MASFLGIDLSKETFHACLLSDRADAKKVFPNTPKGFEQLTGWLKNRHAVDVHVCMEATGANFLFLFSGFLSSFRCVTFYMKNACDDQDPPIAWYKSQIDKAVTEQSILAAFCFLRDSDVHARTLSTSRGVRHTINMAEQTATSEFKLNANDLLTIDKLRDCPWAAELLASDSVVAISEKGLEALRAVADEGMAQSLF